MTKGSSIQKYFTQMQNALRVELESAAITSHSVEKGDLAESAWKRLFEKYLPKRYQAVSHCMVVDVHGNSSSQIDLAIIDRQYTTLMFSEGQVNHVPAESIYAVFEVKQDISREHLAQAQEFALKVRSLHRTSAPIVQAGMEISEPKMPPKILAGFLSTRSEWSDGLGSSFDKALKEVAPGLDFGCAVDAGSWFADSSNSMQIEKVDSEFAVGFFYLRLLHCLQMMGTVPAIDLGEWSKALLSR